MKSSRLDDAQMATCMATVDRRIEHDLGMVKRLAVRGTPAFLLGVRAPDGMVIIKTRISGAQPIEISVSAIQKLSDRKKSGGSL